MKLWMRIATPLTLVLSSSIALQAHAQYAMMNSNYGSGMPYQQCPYNESVGEGASSYLEDIKTAAKELKEAKKQLADKKRALAKLENKDLKRNAKDIDRVISADYTEVLYEHMDNGYSCEEYRGAKSSEETIAEGQEGNKPITAKEKEIREKGKHPYKPYDINVWQSICGEKDGSISPTACSEESSREDGVNRSQVDACRKGIKDYRKNRIAASKLSKEIENLERDIEDAKDAVQTAQENYRDEQRERTEGGVCTEGCDDESNSGRSYKPDYLASGINLAVGGVAMALGYNLERQNMKTNARLGFPSQSGGALYSALGYGAPFLMNGLYGALGGQMGGGAFGCAGGIGGGLGGGIFGNPYGLGGNMLGGGMFLPGMGGMINPYALAGGYPMSAMMGGMIGAMAGGMMPGAYMGGMMPGAYMGGMGAMMPGAFMGGMIGAMAGGMMPGAYMGGMMPGAYMGGMGGMMPGAFMGGMIGAMGGGMMPGAYMGGMMPGAYMGGMGGMMPGAYMGGMMPGAMMAAMGGGLMGIPGTMATGMPMMGTMTMDGGMAQMQMYQQMQQMQMQQYQMYMQQQQQKTQVYAGLQSELQGLLIRMQQVQMGVGIGGSLGIGIGGGLGNGIIGNGLGGGTITGPGGSISGPGIINGNGGGNYFPGNGNINTGPYPVNNGSGLGGSSR